MSNNNYQHRDYQTAAIKAAVNWLRYKDEPAIVVIPTGGGKTIVIKEIIEQFYSQNKRVCLLAHRKELLQQAGQKLSVPFGYYSASIGEKEENQQITVANIQSICKIDLQPFDLIIIDECHRIDNSGENGQYWEFINKHKQAKILGLSATPYRLKGGALDWGHIVYETTYKTLFDNKFLTPLLNKVTNTPELKDIKITLGEFSQEQLEAVMFDANLLSASVENIIKYSQDRKSVLIFTVSVNHSNLLQKVLSNNGIESETIDGKTPKDLRGDILENFKSGNIKFLINCEMLLEGFDAPCIDMIVCLRPTKSKGLHEQMLGRGTRLFEGKENCLLLDMAGNLQEHGGLGSPFEESSKKEARPNKGKACPSCESFAPVGSLECPDCGFKFPEPEAPKVNHNSKPDFKTDTVYNPIKKYAVTTVFYRSHRSKAGNLNLRVDYYCKDVPYGKISEWLSPYSDKEWARNNCYNFFKERGKELMSPVESYSIDDLIFHAEELKKPKYIMIRKDKGFDKPVPIWDKEPVIEQTKQELEQELGEEGFDELW